jgi:hypothetical protein
LVYANAFQEDSDEGLLCSYLRVPILPEEFVERAGRFRVLVEGFGGLGWRGLGRIKVTGGESSSSPGSSEIMFFDI